jgi:hypothetical protein
MCSSITANALNLSAIWIIPFFCSLSKVAGEKLMEDNPFVTDLGDPNRPQKLAEKFLTWNPGSAPELLAFNDNKYRKCRHFPVTNYLENL